MPTPERIAKMEKAAKQRQQGIVIVLEDIHDPHNAEAVFRTCDAFGIQDVCLIFDREKPFKPKRVGKVTSSSANKWLDFTIYRNTQVCLRALKRRGFTVVATALTSQAKALDKIRLTQKNIAILVGNEHRGLSDDALVLSDIVVAIPMRGLVQSLNLSVTTALIIYEVTRQRTVRGIKKYLLSAAKAKRLQNNFLKR